MLGGRRDRWTRGGPLVNWPGRLSSPFYGQVWSRAKYVVPAAVLALLIGVAALAWGDGGDGGGDRSAGADRAADSGVGDDDGVSTIAPGPPRTAVPDKDAIRRPPAGTTYFGVAKPDAPWNSAVLAGVGRDAGGVTPNMVEYYVNWTRGFDPDPVRAAYAQHAVPVVSWEPWAGSAKGTEQPSYALRTIIDGAHDPYIRSFAEAVKANRFPIALRFAHEMNGHWYPWAEPNGGNRPGEYVAAWKHVHDIFQQAGATNVIWVWAPNTLRGADDISLKSLYPGDGYVDWIGLDAYGVAESSAGELLNPSVNALRAFTAKPLLITETGAQPGGRKAPWIASLFPWLASRHDVIGFIWFQYTHAEGGGSDWTFMSSTAAQESFTAGARTLRLAQVP
ncbi:glycosyl hydrolase [Streptomyces sp. NPDC003300]|uniref:glycoside hydrolase family 26 protein n=1 Tax=unclassified Streptomyces TaxID=2593676 RepID=UPI0033B29D51